MKHILSYLIFMCQSVFAQQTTYVLTQNDEDTPGTINIKWYSPSLVHTHGVYIYRKDGNDVWQKLNETPVKFAAHKPSTDAFKKDDQLPYYLSICEKAENLKGLVFTAVLLKSFRSKDLSKHLGIWYDDRHVVQGHSYRYKITQVINSDEITLGVSEEIIAGTYQAIDPPQAIRYLPGKKQVICSWKTEPLRYFAVDIYRKDSIGSLFIKINKEPIVFSSEKSRDEKAIDSLFFYKDGQLLSGRTYTYYLEAIDFFGGNSRPSVQTSVSVKDLEAPSAPYQLSSSAKGKLVRFTWKHKSEEKDLKGFNIYRTNKNDTDYIQLNKIPISKTVHFFEDSVSQFGSYMYKISAVDEANNERVSNADILDVPDTESPQLPTQIKIKSDSGQIVLSWQSGKEIDLAGYLVYRSIDDDKPETFVKLTPQPVKGSSYSDNLPFNSKNRFVYKLVAVDSSLNRSLYSTPVSARLPDLSPPSSPLLTKISQTDKGVNLEWIKNSEPDLNYYKLYRKDWTDSAGKFAELKLRPERNDQFTVDKIRQSGLQEYYLIAVDSTGNSSPPSNHLRVLLRKDKEENSEVNIKFDAAFNDREKKVKLKWRSKLPEELMAYVLYRRTSAENSFSPLSGATLEKNFVDGDISSGESYTYQLRAYTTSGEIHRSQIIIVTIK